MRITQNTLFNTLRYQLSANSQNLLRAQEQMATQKKINRLSDSPIDGGRVLDLKGTLSRGTQYLDNIDRLESMATIQDSTLGDVNDLIVRAKELLLSESNDATSTADTREATRIEVAILTSQMLNIANTRYDGQYIFSGYATDTAAFADAGVDTLPASIAGRAEVTEQRVVDSTRMSYHQFQIQFTSSSEFNVIDVDTGATVLSNQAYASGSAIAFDGVEVVLTDTAGTPQAGDVYTVNTTPPGTYQGDGQIQEVEIQPGTRIQQNIPGNRVFLGTGLSGGVDIFDTLNQINTALAENDRTQLNGLLDQLDQVREQISNERSSVGARVNLLTDVRERQLEIQDNLEILRSNLEDIDVADAITELSKQQNIYEATLGAASQIVQPSLLDFLS